MIVYTNDAEYNAQNNGTPINNIINQAHQTGRTVLDNSNIGIDLNLIHIADVNYDESGDSETDWERFEGKNDGYMDIIHDWRNQYGADLVSIFTYNGLSRADGLSVDYGIQESAHSMVHSEDVGYTYIHEIGHNLGAGHCKKQNYQSGPGLYEYSAGWVDGDLLACTVMSWDRPPVYDNISSGPLERIPYFSNPSLTYKDTWIPIGEKDDVDNSLCLMNTKDEIARYRTKLKINAEPESTRKSFSPYTTPSVGTHYYSENETVQVTAHAEYPWSFSYWKGDYPDGEKYSSSINIKMNTYSKEVTAVFEDAN